MSLDRCPSRGAKTVTEGNLHLAHHGPTPSRSMRFEPARMRFFSLRWKFGVDIGERFRSGLSRGHLWLSVDPVRLRAYMKKHGGGRRSHESRPAAEVSMIEAFDPAHQRRIGRVP